MPDDRLLTEQLFSLRELSRRMTVKRSYSTVRRWAVEGTVGSSGEKIVLETLCVGRARHTSLEAYRRFLKMLAE